MGLIPWTTWTRHEPPAPCPPSPIGAFGAGTASPAPSAALLHFNPPGFAAGGCGAAAPHPPLHPYWNLQVFNPHKRRLLTPNGSHTNGSRWSHTKGRAARSQRLHLNGNCWFSAPHSWLWILLWPHSLPGPMVRTMGGGFALLWGLKQRGGSPPPPLSPIGQQCGPPPSSCRPPAPLCNHGSRQGEQPLSCIGGGPCSPQPNVG